VFVRKPPVVLVQKRCQYMEANPAFCELDLFVAIPVNETISRTGMNEPMKMEQGPLLFSHHCAMRSKAVVHPTGSPGPTRRPSLAAVHPQES